MYAVISRSEPEPANESHRRFDKTVQPEQHRIIRSPFKLDRIGCERELHRINVALIELEETEDIKPEP